MSMVLDISATLAWVYADETSSPILQVFERVLESEAWVPGLWRLEIANVLEMGVRRKRHNAGFKDATLSDLSLLPISLDPHTNDHAWGATVQLAARHGLTVYDAAYLELALRRDLPLASLDRELRAAAKVEKVVLLGE
jgi:predicted nucleic acid-binding protein